MNYFSCVYNYNKKKIKKLSIFPIYIEYYYAKQAETSKFGDVNNVDFFFFFLLHLLIICLYREYLYSTEYFY